MPRRGWISAQISGRELQLIFFLAGLAPVVPAAAGAVVAVAIKVEDNKFDDGRGGGSNTGSQGAGRSRQVETGPAARGPEGEILCLYRVTI